MSGGRCTAAIKRLSWNDFDMDFFDSDDEEEFKQSKEFFSVGVDNKLSLEAAWGEGFSLFYSSCSLNQFSVEIDSQGNHGWSPSGSGGEFVGVSSTTLHTFYAVDIKSLQGSSMSSLVVEYSMDGNNYRRIGNFKLNNKWAGSVKTFYFKAVEARSIRIVVLKGNPNIKFQFYVSSATAMVHTQNHQTDTYIAKTVLETIGGVESGVETCKGGEGCWAGVETCEPREVKGFKIEYTHCGEGDKLKEVKVDYSVDGHGFKCWNNCQAVQLQGDHFTFPKPILAQKVRVHFVTIAGQPSFGITFKWVD